MINKFSKFIFFYLAYLPLFIILLVLNMDLSWSLLYVSLGVIAFCLLLFFPLLKSINSLAPSEEEIDILSNNNSEILGFIFTYIFPFLITFANINSIIAFAILIMMVFLIYVQTSIFSVNPLLNLLFGYSIYEVRHKNKKYFLLSRNRYSSGKFNIRIKQLDLEVLIEDG